MFDILYNCFNSLNFYIILFIGFLLYLINKKSRDNEISKKEAIDSIERRSEECPHQYPNGWLPVYESRDLKNGLVKPIFALGRDLVIYRGTSGKVYVFDAYCPHLGANLGVGGTVVGDDIKCHFHGWEFDNQGHCRAIPGLEAIPKASIKKWRCDEVNDFIYVWNHSEGKDPDWFLPKLKKLETFLYSGKQPFRPYCHIQEIVENEADFTHFYALHGTENLVPKFLQKVIDIKFTPTLFEVCDPPNTHCTHGELHGCLKIGGLTISRVFLDFKSYGPANIVFDVHANIGIQLQFVILFNIITLGQTRQLLIHSWYSEPSILGFIASKVIKLFMTFVVDPDVFVWNRKRFVRNPKLSKLDETIVPYRRWYKQFYSDHSNDN